MKIVVVGSTGLIGSKLVNKLRERGHEAVAAAPNTGVNSITGEGLADALKGASAVVDVTNSPSWEDAAVLKFFETSTRNLFADEAAAGVGHHVALSVVGTDRLLDSGIFRAKPAQENLISSIPYAIVRAMQFFKFVKQIADFSTVGNQVRPPPALFRRVAAAWIGQADGRCGGVQRVCYCRSIECALTQWTLPVRCTLLGWRRTPLRRAARLTIQRADGRRAARPGDGSPQDLPRGGRRRSWARRRSARTCRPKRVTCD